MAKRHTSQDDKQKSGSYYTTNAKDLLSGFEHVVKNECVVEPFSGGGDLARWCDEVPVKTVILLDLKNGHDSIMRPHFTHDVIVTNPPYLSRNKNKNKAPYDLWGQDDLYKCFLAALVASDVRKGILILPSNFISESRSKARDLFFSKFRINTCKYYTTPVFDDASTGICVFDFERWTPQPTMDVEFPIQGKTHTLHKKHAWLVGKTFFDYIYADPDPIKVEILREGQGTNIIISLLTNGKYPLGAHYNTGDPFYASEKTFTTYQVKMDIPMDKQREVVDTYNQVLAEFMTLYDGLFLANYMGAEQKIKSRRYSGLLLSRVAKQIYRWGTLPLEDT